MEKESRSYQVIHLSHRQPIVASAAPTTMLSSLTTKLALRKVGIKSDTFDFSSPEPKASKTKGPQSAFDVGDDKESAGGWPSWMSTRKLPLTAQAWLSPVPPPVAVAECPKAGDLAPLDRDRQLSFGGGRKVVVLFMRCVGCACEFLHRVVAWDLSTPRNKKLILRSDMQSHKSPFLRSAPLRTGTRLQASNASLCRTPRQKQRGNGSTYWAGPGTSKL